MEEDKRLICDLLLVALQKTRDLWDLEALNYERFDSDTEFVTAVFENGGKRKINVSMDSGVAMIRDIMKNIGV